LRTNTKRKSNSALNLGAFVWSLDQYCRLRQNIHTIFASSFSGDSRVGIAGGWGWIPPPVHVYRRSFLSENRFHISVPVQNFKRFDILPPQLF